MVDLNSIPNAPLKIIFIVHFILTSWGIQGDWSPNSYFFYNLIFMIVILWAVHHNESPEPMQFAVVISASSVLLDFIVLFIYFPNNRSSEQFSVGMAILNLMIRPISTLVLYRIYCDRTGSMGSAFPNTFGQIFSGGGGQRTYEDIDTLQSVPRTDIGSPTQFSPNSPDDKLPPPYHGL